MKLTNFSAVLEDNRNIVLRWDWDRGLGEAALFLTSKGGDAGQECLSLIGAPADRMPDHILRYARTIKQAEHAEWRIPCDKLIGRVIQMYLYVNGGRFGWTVCEGSYLATSFKCGKKRCTYKVEYEDAPVKGKRLYQFAKLTVESEVTIPSERLCYIVNDGNLKHRIDMQIDSGRKYKLHPILIPFGYSLKVTSDVGDGTVDFDIVEVK